MLVILFLGFSPFSRLAQAGSRMLPSNSTAAVSQR